MSKDSKLVDLKRTKAEKKERMDSIKAMPMSGEDYSYGTRFHLNENELEKLGHDSNPDVGSEHHFMVKGRVTNSSHDQDESGDPRRSVTVQITHMTPFKPGKGKSLREDIEDNVAKSGPKSDNPSGARSLSEKDGE